MDVHERISVQSRGVNTRELEVQVRMNKMFYDDLLRWNIKKYNDPKLCTSNHICGRR